MIMKTINISQTFIVITKTTGQCLHQKWFVKHLVKAAVYNVNILYKKGNFK